MDALLKKYVERIEEYNAGNYMMFMCSNSGDYVSLILTAYNEAMLLKAFEEDVFGDKGVTYTLVEK